MGDCMTIKELVFFDLTKPDSLDPIDADKFINMGQARMIYATPLEVTPENKLTSSVLSSFSYNVANHEVQFIVRDDVVYSDGTKITVEDVALAITRMLFTRPDFPVIKFVEGLSEWLNNEFPLKSLPSGVKIDKDVIRIQFTKNIENPLFRFTLELFSIVPSKNIDLKRNQLIGVPPVSGYYLIESEDPDSITFVERRDPLQFHGIKAPKRIKFRFIAVQTLSVPTFTLADNSILTGNDFRIDLEDLGELRTKFSFKYLPETSFKSILINPNVPPFDREECRRQFANELRITYSQFKHKNYTVSASIFTKIMPGFLDDRQFAEVYPENMSTCDWSKYEIPWLSVTDPIASFDNNVILKTIIRLGAGMKMSSPVANLTELGKQFRQNKVAFNFFRSGFWAQDVVGDLQMIFTPKMHDQLYFANQNKKLRKNLYKLEVANPSIVDGLMKSVNLALYEDATIVPILHSRFFFAANDERMIRELPQAVVHPSPWQLFNLEYGK